MALYDDPNWGGNGDGTITDEDLIWPHLRLWVDSNHDGVSQPQETGPLVKWNVAALSLRYTEQNRIDGTGSWHRFRGEFVLRVRRLGVELFQVQNLGGRLLCLPGGGRLVR